MLFEDFILEPIEDNDDGSFLNGKTIGAAIEVHRTLGPGLLESAYGTFLIHELKLKHLKVAVQKSLPVFYKGLLIDCGYCLDPVNGGKVIIELKSVSKIIPTHEALSFLSFSSVVSALKNQPCTLLLAVITVTTSLFSLFFSLRPLRPLW